MRAWAVRFADDAFPGFVECALVDAHGATWTFYEKVPVVTLANLDATSAYPQPVSLACVIVGTRSAGARTIVTIDTAQPWGIEATTGETRFDVLAEQLIDGDATG